MLSYLNLLIRQVITITWKSFAGGSLSDWAVKVVIGLSTLWLLYDRNKSFIDNDGVWGALRQNYLDFRPIPIAIIVYVLLYAVFVAPYMLWKDERNRAELAEAKVPAAGSIEEKRLRLEAAIKAVTYTANDREMWFHKRGRDNGIEDKLARDTSAVRSCFPVTYCPPLQSDPISQLHDTAYGLGRELGFAHTLPDRANKYRETLEGFANQVRADFEQAWSNEGKA